MKNVKVLLVLILLLAAFLRLWELDKIPPSLFGDEVDVGYQAYSILKTGKDYTGQPLPLYIHSLSEWRAPLFLYSAVPTVALFGLNEWGVRLPAAIFGILGVFLVYLLGKRLQGERFGLVAAFLTAILPWHIHYSRAAFEVTMLLDFLLAGTLAFLAANNSMKNILAAAIIFALTPYIYSTAVIFTPLYVLLLFFLKQTRLFFLTGSIKQKNFLATFTVTALIIIIPFIQITVSGPASGRFSLLSIFGNDRIIDEINIERTETGGNFERFFHNKLVGWGERIVANYVRSFSPDFLFVRGDPNPRHSVPETGVLYWIYLPFLLFGMYRLLFFRKQTRLSNNGSTKIVVLGWLAIAPIASSLTIDGANHTTRLFLLIPPIIFITAFGVDQFLASGIKWKKIALMLSCLLLLGNIVFYLHRYFSHYSLQYWRYWHYGYNEAVNSIRDNEVSYKLVFINNTYEPALLHYLFWSKFDPARFQIQFTGDVPEDNIYPDFSGFRLGEKLYFGQVTGNLAEFLQPGMLYLAVQGREIPGDWDWSKNPPSHIKVLKTVENPGGEIIFYVVTGVQ